MRSFLSVNFPLLLYIVKSPVITQQPGDVKMTENETDDFVQFVIKARGNDLDFTWKKVDGGLPPTAMSGKPYLLIVTSICKLQG